MCIRDRPWGAGFRPAPRKEPSAEATNAGDTLHLVKRSARDQPFASGTATKRDDPPVLTRIRTLFLLSEAAALIASRTSPALATLLPATSRITSPSLKPRSAAALFGSTSVTTTPSLPAPATLLAGATVRPSFGTSVPRVTPPLSLLSVSALASRVFGNWPRVRLM